VGHATRSSGLFRVEASLARIFQSDLKTGRCMMAGGARVEGGRPKDQAGLKMGVSMQRAASDPATLALPFLFY
jgi:hypothetical protein